MNRDLSQLEVDLLEDDTDLLKKTVSELMEKFGAGNHKPGSGSAAAFQGMVSAKLISTVISLTADEKRKHLYSHCIIELLEFHKQIEEKIYPRLSDLFVEDSVQFDKTIKLREARDKEKDEIVKNQLRRQALEELKVSIEIPFEIASLCTELAEIAVFVFDNAFKSARGDSQVGLSGSVSAIAGCIAIIRLNVLSFSSDEYRYTKLVTDQINSLDENYKMLSKLADSKIDILRNEFDQKIPLFEGINNLIEKSKGKRGIKIEDCVRELQILIWNNRHLIWKKKVPTSYLEILRPDVILKQVMGYDYFSSSRYGIFNEEGGDPLEVLGVIDQPNKIVAVSDIYSTEVQNFTSAHELAHAILHEQSILHRDIVEVNQKGGRDYKEIEADKFATCFLMPKKGVTEEFENRYSKQIFQINEDSAFKFGGRTTSDLKKENKNLRSLSKKLASSEMYNGKRFVSLSELFKVSNEAMAIRLEELDLVRY